MSKKTRPHRGAPASKPGSSQAGSSQARGRAASGQAPSGQTGPEETEADAIVRRVLGDLWKAVAAGEPLQAEIEASTCMEIPRVLGVRDVGEEEQFRGTVLVDGARHRRNPDGAALLRLLMAMGTAATKRAASRALAEMTGEGVYPPEWVTEIGKAAPGRAWRRYDVFGDDEAIAVTFTYGEAEHGILVQVDLAGIPVAIAAGVSSSADRLIQAITGGIGEEGGLGEFDRSETISLAEARQRTAGPLDRMDREPGRELSNSTLAFLPLVRSRVRRLPAEGAAPVPVFTAADRAAAADDFMKSPQAAEAVTADEESTRFWAEVLTGYSGRRPGEPPDQVGPRKLAHILLGHVPNTFVLSSAQRGHLEPAVTAWVRWSAEHRDLGEAATSVLMERLPQVLSRFGQAYDDPDAVAIRGYASGLAASDADIAWLSDQVGRRMFALPLPEEHGPLDLTDPADRRRLVAGEFSECTPPSPMTSEEFVEAAYRVVEDIWRDGDSPAYQAASRMFAEGTARHDIIHRLAGDARPDDRLGHPMSYADVNGISLYYEEHGSGQPLVLLHGGLAAGSMYAAILPELARGRRVIVVDLQAHGHTADADRPLRYETMADDIAGLIGHLGLDQADLMGYSFGAATAVRTAIQHPALVRRLVIVSVPFRRDGWYPESLAGMEQMGSHLADMLKQGPLYESYAAAAPRAEDWPVLLDKTGELLRRDYDWSAGLATITAPAMLVYADADAVRPAHIVDFYARLGGGLRDASWDGSGRPVARLAILPGQTHYDIFTSPGLPAAVTPFLDADSLEPPAPMAP